MFSVHSQPYVDHFTRDKMLHPLSDVPKPKSSFIPSRWEHRKIVKLVHAIKMGWIKMKTQPEKPKFYMLWDDSKQVDRKIDTSSVLKYISPFFILSFFLPSFPFLTSF